MRGGHAGKSVALKAYLVYATLRQNKNSVARSLDVNGHVANSDKALRGDPKILSVK